MQSNTFVYLIIAPWFTSVADTLQYPLRSVVIVSMNRNLEYNYNLDFMVHYYLRPQHHSSRVHQVEETLRM